MAIKLIVGLHNPGASYAPTRHNVGGWFVEQLAAAYQVGLKADKKRQMALCELTTDGVGCKLALPLTYMNHSGTPVRLVSQFYRIEPHELLVVHDDLDLAPGRIKLKTGGGHGGHNGLRDIIAHLSASEFHRLRIGIGHPGHKDQVLDYVLSKPSAQDRDAVLTAIERGIAVLPQLLAGKLEAVMNLLNG